MGIYREALLMGFSKKEAGLCAFATDLLRMARERDSIQSAFLAAFGYASKNAVPQSERDKLQSAYAVWWAAVTAR